MLVNGCSVYNDLDVRAIIAIVNNMDINVEVQPEDEIDFINFSFWMFKYSVFRFK